MSCSTKLLAVANRSIEPSEIRAAIGKRTAARSVQVTLIAPASGAPAR
jgi:hypothetical protein